MLSRFFRLLAASLVPGGGYLVGGWSPATALTLYWIDTVVGGIVMAARIAEHRRLTGASGHDRAQLGAVVTTSSGGADSQVEFRSFLSEFVVTSTGFAVAHGMFLAFLLGFVLTRPEMNAVRDGAIAIAVCHALSLAIDWFSLASWPFKKVKDQAERVMGRVALVNIALIVGTGFMAFSNTPDSFFTAFVWLKAASDIGSMLPSMATREAPGFLVRVMRLFPKQNGETFDEYWRRTRQTEEARAAADEETTRRHRR